MDSAPCGFQCYQFEALTISGELQSTENFIRVLENAFRYFGGVPRKLTIDNLKAAVKKADWYDPEIHPKLQSLAQHYGTVFLPTKPYTPQVPQAGVEFQLTSCPVRQIPKPQDTTPALER